MLVPKLLMFALLMSLLKADQSQVCGGQGVIIRAPDAVIIDGWKSFVNNPGVVMTAPNPANITTDAPSMIVLGKTLVDSTKICIESENGSNCIPLSKVRGLVK